ncbi:DUF1592 domain-containing protein [Lignipirellula cremea]|nr:DUF1592 domain-containing protein [Lignipirellula cremea]
MNRALLIVILLLSPSTVVAADPFSNARRLLDRYCVDCHGSQGEEGKFRIDQLPNLADTPEAAERWGRVLTRVDAGEMPPAEAEKPTPGEAKALLDDIKDALALGAAAYRTEGRSPMRRLNRLEYENTIRDLLGVDLPLRDLLPEDDTADGFDTAAKALSISPVHISRYMAAADRVLAAAVIRGPRPETTTTRLSYLDPEEARLWRPKSFFTNGNRILIRPHDGGLLFFAETDPEYPAILRQFAAMTRAKPGRYRVRVSASTHEAQGRPLTYAIRSTQSNKLPEYFEAPADKPAVAEVEHHFRAGETIVIAPYLLNRARLALGQSLKLQKGQQEPKGLAFGLHWVEVEGPILNAWPPVGHQRLFGDVPLQPIRELPKETALLSEMAKLRNSPALTPGSAEPKADAARLLRAFLPLAFRRPITEEDVAPYLEIALYELEQKASFEAAMLSAYRAVLCAPDFLFLFEEPGRLTDHALATRLSYFLWRSMPDDTLRAAADRGDLRKPEGLRRETERLLASPRASAFVEDFLDQWLHLKDIDATMPDAILFPEYYERHGYGQQEDGLLRASLLAESRLTFADLLASDGSLLNLVDSRETYLNNRLAEHYGLPPVEGLAMRKVTLPADSVRGGVLTHGSVLKVTANGTETSPVLRGIWILNTIVGRSPPPPPPDAGSIEPDTRGATTIREQLLKHQATPSCATCHRQIDPPGFALEAFDPIGQARTNYRTTEVGEVLRDVKFDTRPVRYRKGPVVDASGQTNDDRSFSGIREYKQLLLADPEPIARNLAAKLATFATGQKTSPADAKAMEEIVAVTKPQNYGLKTLIHALVQSDLFRNK